MTTTEQNDKNRVIVFDTTLRDGEQCPGATMNQREKLEIAHQLAKLGVDVIELPVQVNGKVRGRVQLARDASAADARAAALAADGIEARLAGRSVRKFVYVPGQVVNLVVG